MVKCNIRGKIVFAKKGVGMPKKMLRAVYAINFIMQAAFCMICPAGLFVLGGWYLNAHCGWGKWVLITAIVLGVITGFYSMITYIIKYGKYTDPTASGKDGERDGKSK